MPIQKKKVVKDTKKSAKPVAKKAAKKTTIKAKKKATKPTVHLVIVLDKSGSMAIKSSDVIGGYNEYITKLKEDKKVNYVVTSLQFDSTIHTLAEKTPIEHLTLLDNTNYLPSGMTALYDAMGKALSFEEDKKIKSNLVIVITDGEENSSVEYKSKHIKEKIEDKEKTKKWSFVYLGSDPKGWSDSTSMGIKGSYGFKQGNIGGTISSLVLNTSAYSASVASGADARVALRSFKAADNPEISSIDQTPPDTDKDN